MTRIIFSSLHFYLAINCFHRLSSVVIGCRSLAVWKKKKEKRTTTNERATNETICLASWWLLWGRLRELRFEIRPALEQFLTRIKSKSDIINDLYLACWKFKLPFFFFFFFFVFLILCDTFLLEHKFILKFQLREIYVCFFPFIAFLLVCVAV